MGFKYRFAYYLVGFIIGCFFVALVFSGKDTRCNYFPNARVLNDLRSKPFNYSAKAQGILDQKWVTEIDIKNSSYGFSMNALFSLNSTKTGFEYNTEISLLSNNHLVIKSKQ